jgi:hypothetical protein
MNEIIDYDNEGNPIYGPPKETGKSFNDSIKDLFWDVLGREPRPEELSAYRRDFGAKIDPSEEKIFFERSQQEIQGRDDPILNLYKETTGREPTFDEYRATRKELGGDVSAEEKTGFMDQIFQKETLPGLRQRQDPLFQLYRDELGRDPDAAGYRYYQEQFGNPTVIDDEMRRKFLAGGGQEVTSRIPDAFRTLMGRDPTQQEIQELSRNVGTLNPEQMGEYLATKNRAFTPRYGANPLADYVAQNLPSNLTPFTRNQGYVPLTKPNVSASMNLAGQQYYQTPTASGVNYIGAPVNIAPITQGFQPVGFPSSIGGKGAYQQQAPQQFQSMGGKGAPRPITGKGG